MFFKTKINTLLFYHEFILIFDIVIARSCATMVSLATSSACLSVAVNCQTQPNTIIAPTLKVSAANEMALSLGVAVIVLSSVLWELNESIVSQPYCRVNKIYSIFVWKLKQKTKVENIIFLWSDARKWLSDWVVVYKCCYWCLFCGACCCGGRARETREHKTFWILCVVRLASWISLCCFLFLAIDDHLIDVVCNLCYFWVQASLLSCDCSRELFCFLFFVWRLRHVVARWCFVVAVKRVVVIVFVVHMRVSDYDVILVWFDFVFLFSLFFCFVFLSLLLFCPNTQMTCSTRRSLNQGSRLSHGMLVIAVVVALLASFVNGLNLSAVLQEDKPFNSTRCLMNEFSSQISTVK